MLQRSPILLVSLLALGSCGPGGSGYIDLTKQGAEAAELAEMCQSANSSETYDIQVGRETVLRMTNDGACAFSLFLITGFDGMAPGRRAYDTAVLVNRPLFGDVKFVATESATWIEYTPDAGFLGADQFSFRLLPGGGMFPVSVNVTSAQERAPPLRPTPASSLVHFELGRDDLTQDSRRLLDRLKSALHDERFAQWKVDLAGHTDASGAEQYNQRLSERRALAVRSYLIDILGVAPGRISVAGYGPGVPLLRDRPLDGLNRRVHLTFRRAIHTDARPRP